MAGRGERLGPDLPDFNLAQSGLRGKTAGMRKLSELWFGAIKPQQVFNHKRSATCSAKRQCLLRDVGLSCFAALKQSLA